jgi:hypothetical protein
MHERARVSLSGELWRRVLLPALGYADDDGAHVHVRACLQRRHLLRVGAAGDRANYGQQLRALRRARCRSGLRLME